jgi:Asp/Glu/hydantoin racemase
MRIHWQSFIDTTASAAYLSRLKDYLNAIAEPGTTVDVSGISPPDRAFGRLSEFRCAAIAIDNGLAAAEQGYDGIVIGHFQDPGLYELRSAVRIPVVGAGQACMLYGSQLGRRMALITLDDVFEVWHLEQADLYGLHGRVTSVKGMNCNPADFSAAFAGVRDAKTRMIDAFVDCATPLVASGCDVVIPAGVLPGLLVSEEFGFRIGHAPVINTAAVALKSAEMAIRLHRLNGTEPSRGPSFALAPEQAIDDYRRFVAYGRNGEPPKA